MLVCERGHTLFIVFTNLDNLVNVVFLECASDDDEIILGKSARLRLRTCSPYLFFVRIAELNDGLRLAQALGKPGFASLAPIRSAGLNLLET
jgi:hypothetical protein